MSRDERERGKQIVEQMLKDLCAEEGVKLFTALIWHHDFDRSRYWLEAESGGLSVRWPFSYEQLEDSVADRNVRRDIEAQLRQYLVRQRDSSRQTSAAISTQTTPSDTANQVADAFICHASEDKTYVEPLVNELKKAGISVWYDAYSMEWGDSLRQSIDRGLKNCRFGIVVFSKAFLRKKKWTEHELDSLFAREEQGKKIVLPIWHGVERNDLLEYSPAFADRIAKITHRDDYRDIVETLLRLLGKPAEQPSHSARSKKMATAIAHARYELIGTSSRIEVAVRQTEQGDVYVFESSGAEDEYGTKENIAMRFASFDKRMRLNGYSRTGYGNGDRAFDL
jgi:hypothetical protein